MEKRWVLKDKGKDDEIDHLVEVLGVNPVLANLLVQRDIHTFDQAKAFFRPQLEDLHDPFLMSDMNKAVERIGQAVQNKERILIYGDYDVDGTTSVALMYSFFRWYYGHNFVEYYIPDRYGEGYGVSFKGIDYARDNNFSLVIALDCGIKAVEKVKYANEHNVDFIICDHHYPGSELPKAVAVLDPKRADCNYPYKALSGCGVGFKLLQAFARTHGVESQQVYRYLDLVAVSIASDIVPITGENRVLAHYGLKQLNEHPTEGLKAIIHLSNLVGRQITIEDIVFKIGPRINAAGRIESGSKAVDLLVAQKVDSATDIADTVNTCNDARKHIDRNITQDALRMLANEQKLHDNKTTVLYDPDWHKGVVGIVASRLIETYYRPTVILTSSNGLATGSARSVVGYDIYQAIEACSDLLENFGGHMYAAGLTMKIENLDLFRQRFEAYVRETIREDQLQPQVDIDAELGLEEINDKFFRILRQFQPFGPGNMAPVFLARNVSDSGDGRIVGASKEHLKLSLVQEAAPFANFPAIAFQQGQHYKAIHSGSPFDICYSVDENEFRGRTTLQLNIKDIKMKKLATD
ncbi:MAG: single-stranded-DNA-specific exonuclease RecJ [Bacteroidales bacterium]